MLRSLKEWMNLLWTSETSSTVELERVLERTSSDAKKPPLAPPKKGKPRRPCCAFKITGMLGKKIHPSFAFCTPAEHGAFALALLLHGFLRDAAPSSTFPRPSWCAAWRLCALLFRLVVFFNQLFFFRLRRFGLRQLRLVGRALRGPALLARFWRLSWLGRTCSWHSSSFPWRKRFHVSDPRGRHFRCRGFSSLTLEEEHFPWQRDAPSPRPRRPNMPCAPQSARTGFRRAPRKCSPPVAATNAPDHCRSAGSEATLEKRPAGRRDCSAAFENTASAPRPPKAFHFF